MLLLGVRRAGSFITFAVIVAGCNSKADRPSRVDPPDPPPYDTGPLAREAMFGPYDSPRDYCADKGPCDPSLSALETPVTPLGPWKSIDLVVRKAGDQGWYYLITRTERGWFGEFFGFVQFEGDTASISAPKLEIKDALGLGAPQIVFRITYTITAADNMKRRRETMVVAGVGPSGTPTYFTLPTVRLDEQGGELTEDSWSVTADFDGHGAIRIVPEVGRPPQSRVPLGKTPISFR